MSGPFQHGLVIGKFYPPHRGHEHLIRCAAEQSAQVSVIVMASDQEAIALELRVRWLREIFAAEGCVTIVGVVDNDAVDYDSDDAWRAHVDHMRHGLVLADRLRERPAPEVDAVFTSEPYGAELGRRFSAQSICVDQPRRLNPISGTAFRSDPITHWFDVAPCVREFFCRRIVIVGAESTGKSTLTRALQQAYRTRGGVFANTQIVAEYGREYTIEKLAKARTLNRELALEQLAWQSNEFEVIAREQLALENAAARASGPVLICDTDAFATAVWHERYTSRRSPEVEAIAATAPPRAGYLLTDWQSVPFEQDGLRDGEHVREWMHERFVAELQASRAPWVLVSGGLEERVEQASAWIDSQVTRRFRKLFGN